MNEDEKPSYNGTQHSCELRWGYLVGISITDIIPSLVGQPLVAQLLWAALTSRKSADLLNCNLALFHNVQYLVAHVHLYVLFLIPEHHTKVLTFLFVYIYIGGPMSLSFISLERYIAVIHPTNYPLLKKHRYREICVALVWLFTLPVSFLSVLVGEDLFYFDKRVFQDVTFYVLLFMSVFMLRSSLAIARTLKRSGPGGDKMLPGKRKALKTVCATAAITLFCYIPVCILKSYVSTDHDSSMCIITPLCILLLSAASIVHPLLYLKTHEKLCACLKRERSAA